MQDTYVLSDLLIVTLGTGEINFDNVFYLTHFIAC